MALIVAVAAPFISINVFQDTKSNAYAAGGMPNPTCVDNHTAWNSSTTFKTDSAWSSVFMVSTYANGTTQPLNQLIDLNGDGLPDYIYSQHTYTTTPIRFNYMNDCIYLNNGNGWDLTYRCVVSTNNAEAVYYGDCAG
jgi:hypothetical protein